MRSSNCFSRSRGIVLGLLALLLAFAGGGCSAAATPAGTPATPVVSGAWVRPTTAPGAETAAYMTIANPGGQPDALTAVSVSFASSAQIHETTTMSGMTGMSMVAKVDRPAGQTVKLEPGGYHVMITGVTGTLAVGSTVDLVLTFEKAGKVTVKAEVKNG
jgi:copper(I)-binding protein